MRRIYSILIGLFSRLLPLLGTFSTKLKMFRKDRNMIFREFKSVFSASDKVIWIHAASLGEYEQGVPVMEALKTQFPDHKLLLTFFSPSGYQQKKNNSLTHYTAYLPLDTAQNARRFITMVAPEMAFFIKYEFWPNYLHYLYKTRVPTYLVSGVFRPNQIFFKSYGRWMRDQLKSFDHFFVQDAQSLTHAATLGLENVTLSGDTRFDRVSNQLTMDNSLNVLETFKQDLPLLVCGSTWPEDEELLLVFINNHAGSRLKVVIAPHQINPVKINALIERLRVNTGLYSERHTCDLAGCDVLILDTIGLLGRAYSYASTAYVGGATGSTGLHNILEPATFSLPVITGPNIDKFPEAQELRRIAGLFTVKTAEEATKVLRRFFEDESFRLQTGMISGHFVQEQTGATRTIINYLKARRSPRD